jgi:tRNA threonylcarbamoyladenosine biosynthesis protein TsaB
VSADKKILLIESSGDCPFVALTENEQVLQEWHAEKNSGFAMHGAIRNMLDACGMQMEDLDAVSVTAGPGSYTGLRVGMAAAKGICYAIKKPLITVSTLKVMAMSLRKAATAIHADWICPMIDARRDEVFMAIYDVSMQEVLEPCPFILGSAPWKELWNNKKILFSGSGSIKIKEINNAFNFIELPKGQLAGAMAEITVYSLNNNLISNTMWAEPSYLKPFYMNK